MIHPTPSSQALSSAERTQHTDANLRDLLIRQVALETLTELAFSLAFAAITCSFVASSAALGIVVAGTIIQCVVNLFFRSMAARSLLRGDTESFFVRSQDAINSSHFALLSGFNVQTVVHEAGHALAAKMVYSPVRTQIIVQPFQGGYTQLRSGGLSAFGKRIGPLAARCFVVAAGPGFTVLISSVAYVAGCVLRDSSPKLAKYLMAYGASDILFTAWYAYTGMNASPDDLAHDFVYLSQVGLSPLVAAIGLAALPFLLHIVTENTKIDPLRQIPLEGLPA